MRGEPDSRAHLQLQAVTESVDGIVASDVRQREDGAQLAVPVVPLEVAPQKVDTLSGR